MPRKSILVAAHPDDEILWFSSILETVSAVLICYLPYASKPELTFGRKRTLEAYPLPNVETLYLEESEAFADTNFHRPLLTEYGIEILSNEAAKKKYTENYFALLKHLGTKLRGYDTVFTHNPWGEYGHEEHIQVYRAIRQLQNESAFQLWFSNYCSNKSFLAMLAHYFRLDSRAVAKGHTASLLQCARICLKTLLSFAGRKYHYVTLNANSQLASRIATLYERNQCWTWYYGWEWFARESFIHDVPETRQQECLLPLFPLNLMCIPFAGESERKRRMFRFFSRRRRF